MLRALAGEPVWPPPIWLMRQAGRYLPEYRAVRARAGDFLSLCTDPALAAEVTLQPVRRFGMDAAILFSDILILPWALGQGLRFEQGEGPVLDPIRDLASLRRLDPAGAPGRYAPVLETLGRLAPEVDEASLIGFAGAPFTVACYMVDGGGSKEFSATRLLAYTDPGLFADLMALLVDATASYLAAQADAGAEVLMLFDSWAGLLPPSQFDRHVTHPAQQIAARLGRSHPNVPLIGFPRLAGVHLATYASRTGVRAVGLDTGMDPHVALPDGLARQGNLDPLALLAGGAALAGDTDAILAAARGKPWIFNLGHGILPPTPPEHVGQLVARVRASPPEATPRTDA